MTDLQPTHAAEHAPGLPTRRALRAAERAREQAAAEAEARARADAFAEFEAERGRTQGDFDEYGADIDEPFVRPGLPGPGNGGYFPDAGADLFPVADDTAGKKAEEPAGPVRTETSTLNYLAVIAVILGAVAAALPLLPTLTMAALPTAGVSVVVAVIALLRRKGTLALPAIAVALTLAAAGWTGYHQFAPQATTTAVSISVTSTGKTVNITNLHVAGTDTTLPVTTVGAPAPYAVSTNAAGTVTVTGTPANSRDKVTCSISSAAGALVQQAGLPGKPVTCTTEASAAAATPITPAPSAPAVTTP
ncbi:hypothetical protein [Curtobacterium sp. MCBD17_040]|uniref:hypothetical protein n=1 Tax=Curtobacterium sp. MCBD17_040 TaxID=2175674 RepID=UPI000DA97E01|nr:hypothetical protein [Curtobacterium sp. MCBD17_040]WIB65333.1 hypothetical protein DEI94_18170 [Curtobacterium sp. MCBD17_040]